MTTIYATDGGVTNLRPTSNRTFVLSLIHEHADENWAIDFDDLMELAINSGLTKVQVRMALFNLQRKQWIMTDVDLH